MGLLIYLLFSLSFLLLVYGIGAMIESSHYQKIEAKEKEYLHLPAVTSKEIEDKDKILQAELVTGSVVISLDYFKRFLAGLRTMVGGRIKSYETLIDRGRREAILRMKEQAERMGADIILNMRFETANIGQVAGKGTLGSFELLAYGTAVKLKK